jgi:hypothetical protein
MTENLSANPDDMAANAGSFGDIQEQIQAKLALFQTHVGELEKQVTGGNAPDATATAFFENYYPGRDGFLQATGTLGETFGAVDSLTKGVASTFAEGEALNTDDAKRLSE